MTKIRRFKSVNHLTLPSGLTPIDGQPNMRFEPGQTFDVSADKCQTMQRFVLGRLRAGDLEELEYSEPVPAPAEAPADDESEAEPAHAELAASAAIAPAVPATVPTASPADAAPAAAPAPAGFTFDVRKE